MQIFTKQALMALTKRVGFASILACLPLASFAADKSVVLGDYHVSLYHDMYGEVMELEAFTKLPDRSVFFGLGCSSMSPFPVFQVLLFDDEMLSETPKLMSVSYSVQGLNPIPDSVKGLQAVLKPTMNADEFSNKLRIEMSSEGAHKALARMNQGYRTMLQQFSEAKQLDVSFQHRSLGEHEYQFSLQGMRLLLNKYGAICRR